MVLFSLEVICCSHCRAAYLFDESINSPVGFVSLKCNSYEEYLNGSCDQNEKQLMGDPVSLTYEIPFYTIAENFSKLLFLNLSKC